jgi:serine/threonine-protein kinase
MAASDPGHAPPAARPGPERHPPQRALDPTTAPTLFTTAPVEGPSLRSGALPTLEDETARLLRRRLRAAILFLLLALTLYLIRNLFLPPLSPALREFHAVIVAALALAALALSTGRRWTLRGLRRLEWTVFGAVGVYLWATLHVGLIEQIEPRHPEAYRTPFRDTARGTTTVLILYGTFVPNSLRTAARVVLPLALTPVLALISVELTRPGLVSRGFPQSAALEQFSGLVLPLALGVVLALYGAHTIHDLRTREFSSRRFGWYHLIRPLGKGGMGQVFLAEHALLKRPCALKVIRPEAVNDPETLKRFVVEARTTARLTHPHTVEIYDFGQAADGTFYCVMEYLRGLPLDALVESHGPLPAGRVIHLLRPICGALAEAHARGLVHRDVKPANIFAAELGGLFDVAKLLDFGLVKITPATGDPDLSREGGIRGTPLYMSPEQASGDRPLDGRSDLYALGAVAYYLLTGLPPFDAFTEVAALAAHRLQQVDPPSLQRPGIPADLEAVILRCLSKEPDDRYPDAHALDHAFAACVSAADWDSDRAALWWNEIRPGG